jgi:hypothetical protein
MPINRKSVSIATHILNTIQQNHQYKQNLKQINKKSQRPQQPTREQPPREQPPREQPTREQPPREQPPREQPPREQPPTKIYSIIPLNLFQTWHTLDLPPKMKENVELLKEQNPEFTYYLYDDAMCRDFIEKNFDVDVLYTFDKLKPGAFKSDLWRYCVLYKYGGIYLDIKFKCVNNFKLINLTEKEYYVKDRLCAGEIGIYQALLCCFKNNSIVYKLIKHVVENVKNNVYGFNPLYPSGPHLMNKYFTIHEINNLELHFTGDSINTNNESILQYYKEYRDEQSKYQNNKYYGVLFNEKDIYNYTTLKMNKKIDLTRTITKNIRGVDTLFYSGTPTIIQLNENNYLVNLRWINYTFNIDGYIKIIPNVWISLNSRYIVDVNFNKISDEIFLEEDFNHNDVGLGLEDIRIFNYNDKYYYNSTYYNVKRKLTSTSFGIYDINNEIYKLDRNIILPTFYDLNKIKICEKNWSFINYKNDLCMVYNWFPLQIGQINFENRELDIIEIKYNIPDYFKEARGTTCGFIEKNEIWFVLHKAQISHKAERLENNTRNYQHFFAIFDLNMNLLRYSELFKFGDCRVEFCLGLIIKEKEIILSYSLLDTQSIIATYDIDYINSGIKWYINDLK